MSNLSFEEFKRIFRFNNNLLSLKERWLNLVAVSKFISNSYQGDAFNILEGNEFDTVKIVNDLVNNIIFFNDTSTFRDRTIYFLKRAQLLVSDIHENIRPLKNIQKLTAFADYRLPQILRHLGVLVYSKGLAEVIDKREIILPGSAEETEIRAASVIVVDKIQKYADKNFNKKIMAAELDKALWQCSKSDSFLMKPHHRTISIYY